jgi:hypothetical protein
MTINDFWNQAFISALGRLPADEARKEADIATEMCIEKWQKQHYKWAPTHTRRWHEQDISLVPGDIRRDGIIRTPEELEENLR